MGEQFFTWNSCHFHNLATRLYSVVHESLLAPTLEIVPY